ncbi:MAG TPA: nickel-dependent hydrogenase large subunit [Verrucomicrobiae bacterium]
MPTVISIDPVTRLEGHLKVEVAIEEGRVTEAHSTGTLFRGFENILTNRDPWDAPHITQRICGVCPIPHGQAAVLALDKAANKTIPENGRILRNLVLGANFIQSHILHFYHLAALDYIAGPDMPPWQAHWHVDFRVDAATTATLVGHYVQALAMTRKAHEMGAIFGGRMPISPAYIPGGFTEAPTAAQVTQFKTYANELLAFVRDVYVPDVELLGSVYGDYFEIGCGHRNLLAFGVFELNTGGTKKLLRPGRALAGSTNLEPVNPAQITEQVTHSWYADSTNNLNPAQGVTTPQYPKANGYSWLKAPRYGGQPYETGPLARMWVNGDYPYGVSVMDRHRARAYEALKIAQAVPGWADQIVVGQSPYSTYTTPTTGTGIGLTEAPRGALGHWVQIANRKIARYQVITPTCWNASPADDQGNRGPLEEALIGTPVQDASQPVEVLRVVHSFDPCLSCAVHVMKPKADAFISTYVPQRASAPAGACAVA